MVRISFMHPILNVLYQVLGSKYSVLHVLMVEDIWYYFFCALLVTYVSKLVCCFIFCSLIGHVLFVLFLSTDKHVY